MLASAIYWPPSHYLLLQRGVVVSTTPGHVVVGSRKGDKLVSGGIIIITLMFSPTLGPSIAITLLYYLVAGR